MPEQTENTEVIQHEDETAAEKASRKHIDRIAEEVAKKSSRTEQHYDQGHQIISK